MRATAFMMVLFLALPSTAALADVPGLINYQGTLTDGDGVALDTTVSMIFSIYTDSTGGSSVWTEIQPTVVVSSGIFNVLLGRVNSIQDTVFKGPERWLSVQVGGDPELTPRQRIVALGYAFWAAESDTADYARSALGGSDGDWTISGNDMYSAVSGDVGIGTMSPDAKLDVSGNVNADSLYKIKGTTVLSTSGTDNVYVGVGAGDHNIGTSVTLVGDDAGHNNQGSNNTFLGESSGYSNTTGTDNTFLGRRAGYFNDEGYVNTFVGHLAGSYNTTGFANTFLGERAGRDNTEGLYNTFLGNLAGANNTTGYYNTFLGYGTGYSNTAGQNNLFAGLNTGYSNTTGYRNTFLGHSSGYSNVSGWSNVFLGYEAGYHETGYDKLYIANGRDTSDVLIYGNFSSGNVGLGTLSPVQRLDVAGNVQADTLYLGGFSQDGILNLFRAGSSNPIIELGDYSDMGGRIYLWDETGNNSHTKLLPDDNGSGGYLDVLRNNISTGFRVDGNYAGTGEPSVEVVGSSRSALFRMSGLGNSSVQLPTDAIYNYEVWDEPGVASNTGTGIVLTGGVEVQLSRSMTCPTDGYVFAMGTCEVYVNHVDTATSNAYFGVSDNSTTFPANQDIELRLTSLVPTATYDFPVTVHGLFQVSAGANTFYFLAQEASGDFHTYDTQLSLLFLPTAYGIVSPTFVQGQSVPDEQAPRGSGWTLADVAAEQAEAEAFNTARIERELVVMRAELEALKREVENRDRK